MLYSTPLACMWGMSLFFGWLGFSIARKMDAGYVVEDTFSKTVKVTVIRAGERWVPWLGIGAVVERAPPRSAASTPTAPRSASTTAQPTARAPSPSSAIGSSTPARFNRVLSVH
ncbi:predicted protein [Histoplasma capsulatum H143]|uniref:Uncharacterized protein n=1 Tax=Ajellomyces capsulatus (strain H143) TaxID=544712 RepID=C6HBQ1_AJECH|nr:predicted protein [Histoplasma capsulatum H143]